MSNFKLSRRSTLIAGAALATGCGEPSVESVLASESPGATKGFALVELFTSQGCSSCPSADKNLETIAQFARSESLPIYALSFHVDYWNRLGWKDPFSAAQFSQRQRVYASGFKQGRVYTPQMIVNGETEFVGSDKRRALNAVSKALKTHRSSAKLSLNVRVIDGRPHVTWRAEGLETGDSLNIAVVQKVASNPVPRGENGGRVLRHANVVRQFTTFANPKADGAQLLRTPPTVPLKSFEVIAFCQSKHAFKIRAAANVSPAAALKG